MEPKTALVPTSLDPLLTRATSSMIMATQPVPTCAWIQRHLWECLDEELPALEEWHMARHLPTCPQCGPRAAFARGLLDRIAAVRPEYAELPALRARIAARLAVDGRAGANP